jgi:uncharacterized protein DUF547
MKTTLIRVATAVAAFALAAFALAAFPAADVARATTAYGSLLTRYVTPRGVKYDAWRSSGSDLKSISEILMIYRNTDPKALSPDERKALYINLYNAKILETVLLGNPKGSIRGLSKGLNPLEIFSRAMLTFDQRTISLNDLEKRLREEFKDPRIHFAVNCASRSCPPISAEPYVAATLEAQLDEAARKYLASPGTVTASTDGGKTRIVAPKIFDWYAEDFKASGGPLAFIQTFGPAAAAAAIADGKAKLGFANYDWGLNAAK